MARIAIVGAGVTGLSAAYDLSRAGHDVIVYEAGDKVGGLAAGFNAPGWDWTLEKFYHHWFQSDRDLLKLADEMGVRDKILFPRPKTSIWHDGNIYQLDSALSALRLPVLSWPAKIRFGFTMLFLRLSRSWRWLEAHTANEWLSKYMGREAYEMIWKPLLIGKFGEFYKEVNMAWFWARVYSRTPRLGTFEGGFQAFMEVLANHARESGVQTYLSTPVQAIRQRDDGQLEVTLDANRTEQFDAVLSTNSPRLLHKLAPQIEGEYAAKLDALRHTGAVVVIVALKHQLLEDGTYWLNLPANSPDKAHNPFPYLACVEHTNYLPAEHYAGQHLVYLGDYVPVEHEYFQMTEDELAAHFLATLPQFNDNYEQDWLIRHWVFRAPYAQPLPTVHHSRNIPGMQTPIGGLYWASMSQVYPWDRGTNYAVEIGRRAAHLMLDDMNG
jgi:protoporphyrinogen oxidase